MVKIQDIKVNTDYTQATLEQCVCEKLRIKSEEILSIKLLKKSIDARKKPQVFFVLTLAVELRDERGSKAFRFEKYLEKDFSIEALVKDIKRGDGQKIAIVGSGPAGLFCALTLAKMGYTPVVFERGGSVEDRVVAVDNFKSGGVLNTECNIQFGEGGAGTFSDGKLNTGVGGDLIKTVLTTFAEAGAPEEILYLAKPHIGTDKLVEVVKNLREQILGLGGEVQFNTKVDDILVQDGKLRGVSFSGAESGVFECEKAVFATGHSARETYEMLCRRGAVCEAKPFAIGVRIEHRQSMINESQYGAQKVAGLGSADYKLSAHFGERSCFSFCMCPGGEVVPATSEEGCVVTNGMSDFARDKENANSALLVGVTAKDFEGNSPLAGIDFQRKYERLAYALGGESYSAPVQNTEDFLKGRVSQNTEIPTTYARGFAFVDMREVLPSYVAETLKLGIENFENKIKGFSQGVLTGVETRSSAPVKIFRDENFESNIKGLYPCGEGAGWAGGITSSAVDGIKVALALK